jgi:hypothetical protein
MLAMSDREAEVRCCTEQPRSNSMSTGGHPPVILLTMATKQGIIRAVSTILGKECCTFQHCSDLQCCAIGETSAHSSCLSEGQSILTDALVLPKDVGNFPTTGQSSERL